MGPIVCATRGGEASRRTQERAIALAHERGVPLIFLFVADASSIRPGNEALAEALADVLADELEQLGRSLLCIAQARAHEQGVASDMVIRHGAVQPAIESFLREVNAGTLVVGAPGAGSGTQAFTSGEIPQFAQSLRERTGIEVVIVE